MRHEAGQACPSSETLAAFVDGGLDRGARSGLIDHLDHCPVCREVAAQTAQALDDVGQESPRASPRRWGVAALAAAAVLVVVLWVVDRTVEVAPPVATDPISQLERVADLGRVDLPPAASVAAF